MMGEARARKRREQLAAERGEQPVQHAAQVPQLQSEYLSKRIVEQVERRLPLTTYSRQEFLDQIVEAGIAWFDMEMDNLTKAKAQKPEEPLVVGVTKMPEGIAEASARLQEIKSGKHAAEVVGGAR